MTPLLGNHVQRLAFSPFRHYESMKLTLGDVLLQAIAHHDFSG
jgi:hypothetical protein